MTTDDAVSTPTPTPPPSIFIDPRGEHSLRHGGVGSGVVYAYVLDLPPAVAYFYADPETLWVEVEPWADAHLTAEVRAFLAARAGGRGLTFRQIGAAA